MEFFVQIVVEKTDIENHEVELINILPFVFLPHLAPDKYCGENPVSHLWAKLLLNKLKQVVTSGF